MQIAEISLNFLFVSAASSRRIFNFLLNRVDDVLGRFNFFSLNSYFYESELTMRRSCFNNSSPAAKIWSEIRYQTNISDTKLYRLPRRNNEDEIHWQSSKFISDACRISHFAKTTQESFIHKSCFEKTHFPLCFPILCVRHISSEREKLSIEESKN